MKVEGDREIESLQQMFGGKRKCQIKTDSNLKNV